MDLFTHILVAYLVTFGIVGFQPSYLAAGALAGGLPDADALFFPISRRFPVLQHHGITHSLTGVTIVAVAGAFIAPLLAPGSVVIYFLVLEVGGCCHILQDGFTNFAVPPLLPFSKKQLHLDADRAINFFTLIFSVASFYLLLGVERNHVPFAWYLFTVYALMVFFGAYFAIRLAGRIQVQRRMNSTSEFVIHSPPRNA
ncbi:MAG: metal-dependent hydrolase [Thermoplasmata archaeon]